MAQPLLEMTGITKRFGGVAVLNAVDFTVSAGAVVALLGANGAGKSTLVKILSGNYTRDEGALVVEGQSVDLTGPADAIARGIRMLPQELSIFPDMTVAENIMLGALPLRGHGPARRIDRQAMEAQAAELLVRMGLNWLSPRTRMGTLSHHVQRLVEIARALAGNAHLLIMDEPTASLAEAEVRMLFDIVRRLQSEGMAIVYISHYLKEVFEISDRIVVLRDGRNAGDFVTANTNVDAVLEAIVGNRMGDIYPAFAADTTAPASDLAVVQGLSIPGWLHGIDFSVRRGRITGVHGLIGSGVEMIGRGLFGTVAHTAATSIVVDGKPLKAGSPEAAVAAGLGLVAAERKREGIVPMLTLRENMSLSNLARFTRGLVVDRKAELSTTQDWMSRLNIRARGSEQTIGTLSGGNQQKVCLARWLLGDLKLLILEEPTRGVDMGARQEIYRQIRDLADKGLTILLISSDAEEVAGLADRSIVVTAGRIAQTYQAPVAATILMNAASRAATAA